MADDHVLRPSFFELYASERLTSTLRPALRFVLEVLSMRHPSLMTLAARSDELFAVSSTVLELSQLAKYSATMAESFYGLRRSPSFSVSQALDLSKQRLSAVQVTASVVLSVMFPLGKSKLDELFAAQSGGVLRDLFQPSGVGSLRNHRLSPRPGEANLSGRRPQTLREFARLLRALAARLQASQRFVDWYPLCSALYEGIPLIFNVLYMLGRTRYFSPSLALQGLVVRRLTGREMQAQTAVRHNGLGREHRKGPALTSALASGTDSILSCAKYAFIAGIFAFRFLEYYYAAEVRHELGTAFGNCFLLPLYLPNPK
jgi:peroxin-12